MGVCHRADNEESVFGESRMGWKGDRSIVAENEIIGP